MANYHSSVIEGIDPNRTYEYMRIENEAFKSRNTTFVEPSFNPRDEIKATEFTLPEEQ